MRRGNGCDGADPARPGRDWGKLVGNGQLESPGAGIKRLLHSDKVRRERVCERARHSAELSLSLGCDETTCPGTFGCVSFGPCP